LHGIFLLSHYLRSYYQGCIAIPVPAQEAGLCRGIPAPAGGWAGGKTPMLRRERRTSANREQQGARVVGGGCMGSVRPCGEDWRAGYAWLTRALLPSREQSLC
tara:strand:+ start:11029 stop:11337 length:309 start_codon:yes stop_codon:yes gene_type:complete